MLIMAVTYSYIYFIALRHIRAVAANEVNSGDLKKNYKRRQREFKALRSVGIVFLVFVVCWLPSIGIALSAFTIEGEKFWGELSKSNRHLFVAVFLICFQILPPLSSTANPFRYTLFNGQFRDLIKSHVKKLKTRRKNALDRFDKTAKNATDLSRLNTGFGKYSNHSVLSTKI